LTIRIQEVQPRSQQHNLQEFAAREIVPDCPSAKFQAIPSNSKGADLQVFRVDDGIRTRDRLDHKSVVQLDGG
jgi:hypothetical protein